MFLSESSLLQNGYPPGGVIRGVALLDEAVHGFFVLLGVGVEVPHFEEANFEDVFVEAELFGDEGHHGGRPVEEDLVVPADEGGRPFYSLHLLGQQPSWMTIYLSARTLTSLTLPPRSYTKLVTFLRKLTAVAGWLLLVIIINS